MAKLPCCDRCQLYARTPYLVCTVHPTGIEGDHCPDFQPVPPGCAKPDDDPLSWYGEENQWQPDGASYYNGELILQPEQRLSLQRRWELLDTHPMFTGRCPQCERTLQTRSPNVHWDCECGWRDDSI